jgi:hypothetical protein
MMMKQQTPAMAADQKIGLRAVPQAHACRGLKCMLRIHLIQHWFNLADLACEEAPARQPQSAPVCGH